MEKVEKDRCTPRRQDPNKINLMVWDIPRDVKAAFKAKCKERGMSMKDSIIRMMKRFARA